MQISGNCSTKFATATLAKIKSFNLSRSTCLCTRFPSSQSVNVLDDKSSSVIDSKQLFDALRLLHEWKNNLEEAVKVCDQESHSRIRSTIESSVRTVSPLGDIKKLDRFNIVCGRYTSP